MWLNNYFNFMWSAIIRCLGKYQTTYSVPTYTKVGGTIVQTANGGRLDGNTSASGDITFNFASLFTALTGSLSATPTYNSNNFSLAVVFGSGNTPVTAEDYNLDNRITTGLGFGLSTAFDVGNRVVTQTLTATASTDLTIAEIGLQAGDTLLYRKVLPEAINLASGESVNVVFTLNLANGAVEVAI